MLTKRLQPYRILGWLDARTFLVDAYIEGGNGIYLLTVDARSGEFQHAIKVVHRRSWLSAPEVASGPLRNPFVAGVRPQDGLDPRLPAGGAAVVALVAAGVALGLRRRHGA